MADVIGRALLLSRDMKVWQEDSSDRMLENLKRDSVLVIVSDFFFFFFFFFSFLLLLTFENVLRPLKRFLRPVLGCLRPNDVSVCLLTRMSC